MFHESHKRIHKELRKHHPEAVKKIKKIFSFRYPKLFLLIILMILTYYIFTRLFFSGWIESFNKLGQFGVFISGVLTSLGFTAPLGIGLLTKITHQNILFAALIGGLGATVADLLIFKAIKFSFVDEFKRLEKTRIIQKIEKIVKKNRHVLIVHYLLYIFAGIVLATPLPDEIGISMLAGLTTIKPMKLAIIGFLVHSIAIFFIIYLL